MSCAAAAQWDAESPEPHQCMANLLLGQGQADPAYAALQTSIRLADAIGACPVFMQQPVAACAVLRLPVGLMVEDQTMLPSFGFRMGNAKILLELGCAM